MVIEKSKPIYQEIYARWVAENFYSTPKGLR